MPHTPNARTHGLSASPTYRIWGHMVQRCCNPNDRSFVNYGGRGIKVCEPWLKFANFLADMGERPSDKHEISRIDNDGDYEPGNVQWSADAIYQARNRRKFKKKSSKYRGVDLKDRRWRARITILKDRTQLIGYFDTEEEAARAYDAAARRLKGFSLNFPTKQE